MKTNTINLFSLHRLMTEGVCMMQEGSPAAPWCGECCILGLFIEPRVSVTVYRREKQRLFLFMYKIYHCTLCDEGLFCRVLVDITHV